MTTKNSKNKTKSTKQSDPKAILITGGAGFIGSNVLRYMWKKYPKAKFYVLDSLTYAGDMANIPDEIYQSKRFSFQYGDIRNAQLVDAIISQCDVILHFAAETHVARSIYDDSSFFETDVIGTQVIANAVLRYKKNIRRFIHVSTSEVYGTALEDRMSEEHPLEPQSPYAAAKLGADRLVYAHYITHGIPAVIVRPFNQYGPNQHLEKLIPRFITSILLGEQMTIHGTGQSERDFTHVDDLAHALELIINAPDKKVIGEVFNVGNDVATSVLEISKIIEKLLPSKLDKPPKFTKYTLNIGDRPGQVFKHISNTDKIRKTLGWKPKVSLEEGIDKTIDWYINNQEWWKSKVWMRHVDIMTSEGKKELH